MATRKKIPLIPTDAALTLSAGKTISSSVDLDVSGADITITGTGTAVISFPSITSTLLSTGTAVTIAQGGTGASGTAAARTNLGLVIGTNIQAYDAQLTDIAELTPSGSTFIIGNGSNFITRSTAQVCSDLDLVIGTNVQAWDNDLDDLAALSHSGSAMIMSNGTDWIVRSTAEVRKDLGISKAIIESKIIADATTLTTGDGKLYLCIPPELNGYNLTDADAFVSAQGTAVLTQVYNFTDSQDMLSTGIWIDQQELTSYTAQTAVVINTSYDDVATGDIIRIDVDQTGTAKGLGVILTFTKP